MPLRLLIQIERFELVPLGMILRLEERIEVPERGEHKVSLDPREAHAEEDSSDPLDVRAEDVALARSDERRERLRVVSAEGDGLPLAGFQQGRWWLGGFPFPFNPRGRGLLSRGRLR